MKLYKFIFILVMTSLTQVMLSHADPQATNLKLNGNSREQVLKLLGEPNRSSSVPSGNNSSSSETLYYGDSQVTLVNNKVISIFDMGEIKDIINKKSPKNLNGSSWTTWPNPWTSPQSLIKKNI